MKIYFELIYIWFKYKLLQFWFKAYVKVYMFIKYKLLWIWFRAFIVSVYNEYIDSDMFKERVKVLGRFEAKAMFMSDHRSGFISYYKKSLYSKPLKLLVIIFLPFLITSKDPYFDSKTITRQQLGW